MTATVPDRTEAPTGIELFHLSPTIGTEVLGIDLREELSDETVAWLRSLMLDRKVIFFRDQDISVEQHMAFAKRFGQLEIIPFLPQHPDYPEVLQIKRSADNKATENIWHSDVSWREQPSLGSILRAHVVPVTGGDTMFADMTLAYDRLSEGWKRHAESLTAEHSIAQSLGVYMDNDTMQKMLAQFPPQRHPVIRTHPETGRKLIYVNDAHTSRIVGVSREESRLVLQHLYQQAWYPEVQCRFHWRPNSIAFWDNRSCQHYAVQDYYPARRDMDRVTIVGDRPF